MATVHVARQLLRFFPTLQGPTFEVAATTAAEVLQALDALAPGLAGYVVDERGRLRQHVNLFVDQERVVDREALSDPVGPGATVHILQALSGG